VRLSVEGVVDRRVGHEEPLGRCFCFEQLHFPFSPLYRQVRVLWAIVIALSRWSAIVGNASSRFGRDDRSYFSVVRFRFGGAARGSSMRSDSNDEG
jgi:hypothetical protein